jgi:Ser/Thr protein kinase RdoA (MazF antagonist)
MPTSSIIANNAHHCWPEITGEPRLIMHRENAVYKVETRSGPAALRVHRPNYHSKSEIASELTWMAYLSQGGLEIPAPYSTKEGALLAEIADDRGQTYITDLLSWVDGEPLGRSHVPLNHSEQELNDIFREVGRNLALLHDLSDGWVMPPDFHRHALDKEGLIGKTAAWGQFWAASVASDSERKVLTEARDLAGKKLDALVQLSADYGLIHADLVRENIFVSGGKVSFIDFDDAGFGFRMFDLAVALIKNREEPHYETIKAALFAGYTSRRDISPPDGRSLDLFMTLRDFALLGWVDARRQEAGIPARIETAKRVALLAASKLLQEG